MQRCSSSDCGDASLDASVVVSSICDERLGQMWYNDTTMIRSRLTDECLAICGISATEASDSEDSSSLAATCLGKGSDYYNIETQACTGADNQVWEWISTSVGSVLFNMYTNQAVTVCSDLEPWCGFLLLLGFDGTWSARRLTGVQLPANMSAITPFQTFSGAALTKTQASLCIGVVPNIRKYSAASLQSCLPASVCMRQLCWLLHVIISVVPTPPNMWICC